MPLTSYTPFLKSQTCPHVNWVLTGAWEQFQSDALPDATGDLYEC